MHCCLIHKFVGSKSWSISTEFPVRFTLITKLASSIPRHYKETCFQVSNKFLIQFRDLKHNLFKNVSNWVTFLWQRQIQTIKCGLNHKKRKKRFNLNWFFTHLHPLIWISKHFWCPKWYFSKILSQEIYSLGPFLS